MSASREKKQRQGAGPSEKATQVQKEQAAYKLKARIYTIIGVVVVVLIAALLIWNSGLFQSRAAAATIGEKKLSVAELSYYYYDARYFYAAYGMIDTSKADDEQMYDDEENITFRDYFLETALTSAQRTEAMYDAAIAAGHSLSEIEDDLAAEIDGAKLSASTNGYSYKSFLKTVYGRYMTPDVYKEIVGKSMLANLYYTEVQAEKQDSFTAEDLEAYYAEHTDELDEIEFSYLYFKPANVSKTDSDGKELSEDEIAALEKEAMEDAKAKAEAALKSYNDGVSIADLIEAGKPTNSAERTVTQGVSGLNTNYSEELLALGADEAALVESEENGYYVVIFHSRGRNEEKTADVRHILFRAETSTDSEGTLVAPTLPAWSDALAKAEDALAEYEAGDHTAEAFGALAEKYSEDGSSNTNGGLYENVTEGRFVTEFNDWMFGEDRPEAGDTAVIRHEGDASSSNAYWGYHVVYFQGWAEAQWELDTRGSMTTDAMTEWSDNILASGYETALASGANNLGR